MKKFLLALLFWPVLALSQVGPQNTGDWGIQVLVDQVHFKTNYLLINKLGQQQFIFYDGAIPSARTFGPNIICTSTNCDVALTVGPAGPQGVKGDIGNTGAAGPVYVPPTRVFTVATRTLNTAYQLSTTQDTHVAYEVDIAITSLLATTQGTVFLDYADNSTFTTNLVTISSGTSAIGGVLSITNTGTVTLSGIIPAGKYMRIRTANTAGTPTITYRTGQEVQI